MGCGLLSSNELGFGKGRDPGGWEHKGWLVEPLFPENIIPRKGSGNVFR